MTIVLSTSDIRNRRVSLNLDAEALANKNDATAVEKLLMTWRRDMGVDSPVVNFKQIGVSNSDTH